MIDLLSRPLFTGCQGFSGARTYLGVLGSL